MTRRACLSALAAAVALLVSACGQNLDTSTAGAPPARAAATVYDYSATTVDGASFDGGTLAGKPAVLWFWAPWCSTCRAQVDGVTALAQEHDGDAQVVGVGSLDAESAIRAFAEEYNMGIPQLIDRDGEVWRHFGVTAQSTYVVLDASGEVVADGSMSDAELAKTVGRLTG